VENLTPHYGGSVVKNAKTIFDEQKEAFAADPVGLIRAGYLYIRNKEADMVPLVPNATQNDILEKIQMRRKQHRPVRLVIVKARQEGVSTIAQAVGFSFTSQRSNMNALDIADDVDGASYIFKMNEMFYDKLVEMKPHLAPEKSRSDEKRLEFLKTYSRLMIDTANNSRAGRKFTLQFVHLSEVAFFKNFREIMQALKPAVPDNPETIMILESTANGLNEFSKFYWKIKAQYEADPDSTDWIPLFYSWKLHLEYSRAFSSIVQKEQFEKSLSEKECEIRKEHGLSLEQLHWRRRTIDDSFDGDMDKFEVEYPLTDKEAFKSTSKQIFPARLTDPQKVNIMVPKLRGEMELVDRRPSFVPDARGFLKIYQESQPEERYVIGADTCESALTHDEACAQVIKRSTWTQVAHLHGHMNPEDFAQRLIALGLYYNRALLSPERNGPGLVTVTFLANKHYPNICKQKRSVVSDQGQWQETEEYGFHTNSKTKPMIIDQLQNSLRNLLLVVHDQLTLDELETYVVRQVNKEGHVEMGAEDGWRDDCTMALAIAVHYAHQLPAMQSSYTMERNFTPSSKTGY
jgi:hypothetical protein